MSDRCKACGDLQSDVPVNVLFHPFPVDIEKCLAWEEKCREGGLFDASQANLDVGQNWTVCSRHFRKVDYLTINNDIHILRPNATPSIFKRKSEVAHLVLQSPGKENPSIGTVPIVSGTTLDIYKQCSTAAEANNWKNRCRICGKLWSNGLLINLFGDKGTGKKLSQRINKHMPITVKATDSYPLRSCKHCIDKLEEFDAFFEQCRVADVGFRSEVCRFKCAKEKLAKEQAALEKAVEEEETRKAAGDVAGKRTRKSNPAGTPSKRESTSSDGPETKRTRNDSSGIEDDPGVEIFAEVKDESGEQSQKEQAETVSIQVTVGSESQNLGGNEEVTVLGMDPNTLIARSPIATRRFNLRVAPRPNVNLPMPVFLITRQPINPGPSILRQNKVAIPPLPSNKIRLPPTIYPRRTRRRGPKDRKPRSKRFFMTRRKYGGRSIQQKCDSKDCTVVCGTVDQYLEHKYLYHDESNFSFCRVCSQVYETKPRSEDNGHRHLPPPAVLSLSKDSPKLPLTFRCEECNKDFQDKAKLTQHNRCLHGSFNCNECGKKFSSLTEFKKHLQDHIFAKGGTPHRTPKRKGNSDKFTCEICKTKNTNFTQLNIHVMKTHDTNFQYLLCNCGCNAVFYTDQLLRLHQELQSEKNIQLCENCGGTFATIDELRQHRKACTSLLNPKPLACTHCDLFIHPNKMRAHLMWHITRQGPDRCQKCLLQKWTTNKHNCKFYRCEVCQLGFNGYPRYLAHKRTHVNKDAMYFCNVCEQVEFAGFDELVEHFKEHTPEEVKSSRMAYIANLTDHHVCPICLECLQKNVIQKHHRNKHEELVAPELTEEEILTCPQCEELQPDVDKYIEHRVHHETPLMLRCPHCPLEFDNENRRSIHMMRLHNVEKQVYCDFCSKMFNSTQKLRIHIMRHIKYKPFVCKHPGCKAAYYLVGDWRKHSMLHLGINPNVCKICNKQFMKTETLVMHNKKWHSDVAREFKEEPTAEVVYQCCKCEYQNRSEAAVLEHLEKDHTEEVIIETDLNESW